MRVLFINTLYSGGGAERSARELMAGVGAAGADVSMLASTRGPGDPATVKAARMPGERALRALERRWGGPLDWTHLGSKLALRRVTPETFDVVHLHNLHGDWISIKAAAALTRRMPCVWTLHDEWAPGGGVAYDMSRVERKYADAARLQPGTDLLFPDTRAAGMYRRLVHGSLPQPVTVIAPSAYLTEMARRSGRFSDSGFLNVPYGLRMQEAPESTAPQADARRRFGLEPGGRVVLLMAANFRTPFKGIPAAVDALNTLPADAFTLLVVGGDGGALAGRVPQRVVSTGYLKDDAAIASAYRAGDVTLVPSLTDNFPYVGLESMACERPLAAFRVGGLAEMVGSDERGLAATPFDVAELGRTLMTLLGSAELRARLGGAGRRWVSERCDMRRWVSTHLDVYRDAREAFAARRGAVAVMPPSVPPRSSWSTEATR